MQAGASLHSWAGVCRGMYRSYAIILMNRCRSGLACSGIKMKIFIMVIRRLCRGRLDSCVWVVRRTAEPRAWWLHTWISHIPGLSIFHQTSPSIIEAVLRPGHSPDGGRLVALIQPLMRRDDVHTPQSPVVAVCGVGVLLHLERVVLDVVYGGEDDARVILLHPCQDGFSPLDKREREVRVDFLSTAKLNSHRVFVWSQKWRQWEESKTFMDKQNGWIPPPK